MSITPECAASSGRNRGAAERLLGGLGPIYLGIRTIIADAGYQSPKLGRQLMQQNGWKLVIVKRGRRVFKITSLT
ncbi:MAG TPA: hypothetical protein VGG97_13515 [Bryobacteraceae bacterium]|jgi:hypothetical protein